MTNLSTQQLAELLVGIARAQQAIVDAIESSKVGFKSTHLAPALMNASRVRDTQRPVQLGDLPSRVLMQCMGRNGPNVAQIAKDLDELIARANRPANDSLDMTKLTK
jgi:hypothetical protein